MIQHQDLDSVKGQQVREVHQNDVLKGCHSVKSQPTGADNHESHDLVDNSVVGGLRNGSGFTIVMFCRFFCRGSICLFLLHLRLDLFLLLLDLFHLALPEDQSVAVRFLFLLGFNQLRVLLPLPSEIGRLLSLVLHAIFIPLCLLNLLRGLCASSFHLLLLPLLLLSCILNLLLSLLFHLLCPLVQVPELLLLLDLLPPLDSPADSPARVEHPALPSLDKLRVLSLVVLDSQVLGLLHTEAVYITIVLLPLELLLPRHCGRWSRRGSRLPETSLELLCGHFSVCPLLLDLDLLNLLRSIAAFAVEVSATPPLTVGLFAIDVVTTSPLAARLVAIADLAAPTFTRNASRVAIIELAASHVAGYEATRVIRPKISSKVLSRCARKHEGEDPN
mmetsp:Transcript_7448/g.15466  ORF Transcript_7448/g.15466 Transcript_7448/m.15466 type:complete len:390 (-) Transcript_7448:124-1293(-)